MTPPYEAATLTAEEKMGVPHGRLPDEPSAAKATTGEPMKTEPISTQHKFDLLLGSLHESNRSAPLTIERQLVQELFLEAVLRNDLDISQLGSGPKHPTNKEKDRLLALGRLIQTTAKQPFAAWEAALDQALLLVVKTKWRLVHALDNVMAKLTLQQSKPLHEWVRVIGGSSATQTGTTQVTAAPKTSSIRPLTYNPAKYTPEMQQRLEKVSMGLYRPGEPMQEGTADEWRLIEGIVNGDILCTALPSVALKLLGTEGAFELQLMIHANVEGVLVMSFHERESLHETQRTTERVLELIETAAMAKRQRNTDLNPLITKNLSDLSRLLADVKTVHYDGNAHALVFTFFTRRAALRHEHVHVPFGYRMHTLRNPHHARPPTTTGILRMQRQGMEKHYAIRLCNLTRSMDLRRLHSWLKSRIPFQFELADLDTYNKHSRTSSTWELRFPLGQCPECLRGKNRILWFGEVIVLQHPRTNYRNQCLACGDAGHKARACGQTSATLSTGAAIVVSDEELAKLGDPRPVFKTLADLKAAVVRSKKASLEKEEKAAGEEQASARSTAVSASRAPTAAPPVERLQERVARQQRTQRAADLAAARQTEVAATAQLQERTKRKSWPVGDAATDLLLSDDDDDLPEGLTGSTGQSTAIREATGATSSAVQMLAQLEDVRASTRASIRGMQSTGTQPIEMNPIRGTKTEPSTFREVHHILGLRELAVPATGNCQALAVAEAVTEQAFTARSEDLSLLASLIKQGVNCAAKVNFEVEFTWEAKLHILQRCANMPEITKANATGLLLGWLDRYTNSPTDGTTIIAEEVWGNNDTLRMIAMVLKRDIYVLGQEDGGKWTCARYEFCTTSRKGAVIQTAKERVLTIHEAITQIGRAKTKHDKAKGWQPIVIRYRGKHYTAYTHSEPYNQPELPEPTPMDLSDDAMPASGPDSASQDEPMSEPTTDEDVGKATHASKAAHHGSSGEELASPGSGSQRQEASLRTTTEIKLQESTHLETKEVREMPTATANETSYEVASQGSGSQAYAARTAWQPEDWDGDEVYLRELVQEGPTVSHELKKELQVILDEGGNRKAELIASMTNTVGQLSRQEAVWLRDANLTEGTEVTRFMQKYSLSAESLRQWQVATRHQDERFNGLVASQPTDDELEGKPAASQDSAYVPESQDSSNSESQELAVVATPIQQGKRGHKQTPMLRRQERRDVVNAHNAHVPLKKSRGQDDVSALSASATTRNLLHEFSDANEESDSAEEENLLLALEHWPDQWAKMEEEWSQHTNIPFPRAGARDAVWVAAAAAEPDLLVRLLRGFQYPHKILERLNFEVLVAWTQGWRRDYLIEVLERMRTSTHRQVQGPKELATDWVQLFSRLTNSTTTRSMLNVVDSRRMWDRVQALPQGGTVSLRPAAPQFRSTFGCYLLCARVYTEEIAALHGTADDATAPTIRALIARLFQLQRRDVKFQQILPLAADRFDWDAIHHFLQAGAAARGTDGAGAN